MTTIVYAIWDFGLHGCLPKIKTPYVCTEAAKVAPSNAIHGCLPGSGHLSGTLQQLSNSDQFQYQTYSGKVGFLREWRQI